ncbi:MAG: 2-phospho-L-lactate guanylyltransferase [Acidimicrobiales bacterium]
MRAAVLLPIKSFEVAKGRLAGALDLDQRAELARRMASGVIAACHDLPTWVICDDPEVASLAISCRANVLWRPARGLNVAVHEGVEFLAGEGYERVVVSHADLPLARDLTWVADAGPGVTIVPDRRDDGTNVMAVPTDAGFRFAYGVGSSALHRAEAERLGLEWRLIPDAELGWDVDVPEDLTALDGG